MLIVYTMLTVHTRYLTSRHEYRSRAATVTPPLLLYELNGIELYVFSVVRIHVIHVDRYKKKVVKWDKLNLLNAVIICAVLCCAPMNEMNEQAIQPLRSKSCNKQASKYSYFLTVECGTVIFVLPFE